MNRLDAAPRDRLTRPPRTWAVVVWLLSTCAAGVACQPASPEGLVVQLQTDLVPGLEFDRIDVEVDGEGHERVRMTSVDRVERPRAIASFRGLADGRRVITMRLSYGPSVVVTRTVQVAFRGSLLVNVVISRSCAGIVCDDDETCIDARCVGRDCLSGREPGCSHPSCIRDSDCSSHSGCVAPQCVTNVCLDIGDDAACGAGERCVGELGCVATATPDSGTPDAAPLVPEVPTGLAATPESQIAIAVVWTEVANAVGYEVEYARTADLGDSITVSAMGPSQRIEPLAAGARYFMRVRALGDGATSPWSEAVSAVTNLDAPPTPSLDVAISPSARPATACCWIDPPDPGNWYFARGNAATSCAAGTNAEFAWEAQYTRTTEVFRTGWMGPEAFALRPLPMYGVTFRVSARCVGPDAASGASGTAALCRMANSTPC